MSNEATEALQRQRALIASVEAMENAAPLLIRLAETNAAIARANYLALIKEGFTEAQALTLCKVHTA